MLFRLLWLSLGFSYSALLFGVRVGILKSVGSVIDFELVGYMYLFFVRELTSESEFGKLLPR